MKFLSTNRIAASIIALSVAGLLFSCKKENSNSPETSDNDAATYSSESMEADASFDDIQDIGMTAAEEEGLSSAGRSGEVAGRNFPFISLRLRIGQCADITVSPQDDTYPKTVTLDFGNGCLGLDGKFRKGKIVLHFSGPVRQPGSVVTITLVDFELGSASIEGTKVITNLSENGQVKYSVQVTGGKVTFPNGRGYAYEKLKYVKQIAGETTDELNDDVYTIEGYAKTTYNNGVVITLNILDNLIKKLSCPWISEGTLNIKVNATELSLDYSFPSNGDCDNKALLSWNNNVDQRVILLP